MASGKNNSDWELSESGAQARRDVLGYLNFSSGQNDSNFLRNLNLIWEEIPENLNHWQELADTLQAGLVSLKSNTEAFADTKQSETVTRLLLPTLEAYQQHHSLLLFHLDDEDYDFPFLAGRVLEAILQQDVQGQDEQAVIAGALNLLNDYVGYRPVAILENGRKSEIYSGERICPVPLYVAEAGISSGRYDDLIAATLELLRDTPADLLHGSHFDLDRMQEMSCDPRAYDHLHPTNKRTNYMFGEWDPHRMNTKGDYTRFIVRQIILDSLLDWIEDEKSSTAREERLFDAAAAMCGTMLMASAISGSNPHTHDSTISLATLLPMVARRRDEFYARLMAQVSGPREERLQLEQSKTQQPFGHIRQFLNMRLAGYGARQVQHRELAHLFAAMGYAEESRLQADAIPAASIRSETEIECTIASAHQEMDRGNIQEAGDLAKKLASLINAGIECGAIVDPWNILGFQGQFPLFSSREDTIPDNRVEVLLSLMEGVFAVYSRMVGEAAAKGQAGLREEISVAFQSLADWWDRFGSDAVSDLPDVSGQDSWESANHVSQALQEWRDAGESAGDISFWRKHVDQFQSAKSYALVVDALLNKQDSVAAMALMMQWISQVEDVGVDCPPHSLFSLLLRWIHLVTRSGELTATQRMTSLRRMFDYLEANAEEWWGVPNLGGDLNGEIGLGMDNLEFGGPDPDDEEDEEDQLFKAAYDDVVFKDTAEDGNWGDTAENDFGIYNSEFEIINREIEPRIKFLNTVGQLWQLAASSIAKDLLKTEENVLDELSISAITTWHRQSQRWQIDLAELMEVVWDYDIGESSGDHDANIEYDMQLQVKYFLINQIVATLICLRNAERLLNGIIPDEIAIPRGTEQDRQLAGVYRAIVQRDVGAVREMMPGLLNRLSRNPLLYVPLEHGGEPGQVLRIQALQSVVRFLLKELPKLGLLRETWHTLYTAYKMERKWRPRGQAITEFDRLFQIALKSTLEAVVHSVSQWSEGEVNSEDLVEAIDKVLDPYQWLWFEHSRTMRISSVDGMRTSAEWEDLAEFIQTYGHDLFHASQLTLGHVRAILHNGVDWYLDYLEEEQDPIHPIRLLNDIDAGVFSRSDAEWNLEQVYTIVVDRFDRFLEYNTTTTQSDYGEMLYCLLDFLRLEAAYDRDAWNLVPLTIVHEVFVRNNLMEAAEVWESSFELQTSDKADQHLRELRRLQKKFGMRMPAITDHLRERFVKPLAVNRMLALVDQSVKDSRAGKESSRAFSLLSNAVNDYLEDSWGSGVDIPEWLRLLEKEVVEASQPENGGGFGVEADIDIPALTISRVEFGKQAAEWRSSLLSQSQVGEDSEEDSGEEE